MNKITSIITSALLFASLGAKAVQAPKPGFTINGKINGQSAGKIYLSHEYKGTKLVDSATLHNGAFTFKGVAPDVLFYTLKLTRIDTDYNASYFLLVNTTVTFTANKDSLNKAAVKGLKDNDIYMRFYDVAWKSVRDSAGVIYGEIDALTQKGKTKLDSVQQKKVDKEFEGVEKFNKAVIDKYVNENANSVAAAVIIYDRYISYANLKVAGELYGKLPEKVKATYYGKEIKKALDIDAITAIGKQAPGFAQPDSTGKMIDLKDYKGKYVLVDFWASWCGPCRAENPNLVKSYHAFHGKGFEVLSVSMDSQKAAWLKAVTADKLDWQHVSDLKGWGNVAAAKYGVKSIPQNFLVNPDGVIVARGLRGAELDKKLAAILP